MQNHEEIVEIMMKLVQILLPNLKKKQKKRGNDLICLQMQAGKKARGSALRQSFLASRHLSVGTDKQPPVATCQRLLPR